MPVMDDVEEISLKLPPTNPSAPILDQPNWQEQIDALKNRILNLEEQLHPIDKRLVFAFTFLLLLIVVSFVLMFATPFLRGDDGSSGATPAHRWQGTSIQFQNPDQSWGELVDIQGSSGNIPTHRWQGTSIQFENPDQSWGELVDVYDSGKAFAF